MTQAEEQPWQWEEARWRGIVDKVRAGRSLKPATWPGGARCAVALSFDSDHESTTLRLGQTSPGKLSQGEYGSRAGIPRIRRLLDRHGIRASFFVPAVVAELHPDEQRALADEGHEIGIHGWIHEYNSQLPPEAERDLQLRSADTLERISGQRPVGMRTPSWDFSAHTLAIAREMGLLYDSSLMADDEPYELLEDGEPTGVVELPARELRIAEVVERDGVDGSSRRLRFQHVDEHVVRVGVELLDVLALDVRVTGVAEHPGEPRRAHA